VVTLRYGAWAGSSWSGGHGESREYLFGSSHFSRGARKRTDCLGATCQAAEPQRLPRCGVVARPDRTAKAVLAMLTLLVGRRLDEEVLQRLLPLVDPADGRSIADSLHHQMLEEPRRRAGREGAASPVGDIAADRPLRYALALLRYYRPGFDSLATEEKRELLQKCCERINGLSKRAAVLAGLVVVNAGVQGAP
jgi:hypothetical protein